MNQEKRNMEIRFLVGLAAPWLGLLVPSHPPGPVVLQPLEVAAFVCVGLAAFVCMAIQLLHNRWWHRLLAVPLLVYAGGLVVTMCLELLRQES